MKTATKTTAKPTAAKPAATKAGVVKPKSTAAEDLRELYVDSLKDIYWAEKALLKALPKMAKNATTQNLVTALNEHTTVTEGHVARLEKCLN